MPRLIPRRIHQTWKVKERSQMSWHFRRWVRSWERKNPGHAHELSDDDDCLTFVREHFPEHAEAFLTLRPVEKADFWRIMAVHVHGGVYTDIDTVCHIPVDDWIDPQDRIVIGLELDFRDDYPNWTPTHKLRSGGVYMADSKWRDNLVMFCNWTFAAAPGTDLMADVIRRIGINATDPFFLSEDWTIKKTGPGALTDSINDYLSAHGATAAEVALALRTRRDHRVGDIRFLDHGAFRSKLVQHQWLGSWKPPTIQHVWRRVRAYWS